MSSEETFLNSNEEICNSSELTDTFSFEGLVMVFFSVSLLKEHLTAQRRYFQSWEDFGGEF